MKFGIYFGGPEMKDVRPILDAILKALTAKGADQATRQEAIRAIAGTVTKLAPSNINVTGCSVTERGKR